MKPVLQKVAAGIFEDKLKPYYENEIKPYSNTLSAGGIAAGAGLGGTLGYLANKYLFDGDSPTSAVLSSLAGSLAGASLYTANEIWSEKKRKEANKKLPRGKRVLEDGRTIEEVEDENTPWYGGPVTRSIATVGGGVVGGLGGDKAARLLYDRIKYRQPGKLGIFKPRTLLGVYQKNIDEANAEIERLAKNNKGYTPRDLNRRIRQANGRLSANENALNKAMGHRGISRTRKIMRGVGGTLGALAAAAGMYYLTDPGSRAKIAEALDGE